MSGPEPLTVYYQQHLVAMVSAHGARLEPHIEALLEGDPDRRFFQVMAAYATAVIDGEMVGPFESGEAEALARKELMPPTLFEGRTDQQVADRFRLSLTQVTLRRQELSAETDGS